MCLVTLAVVKENSVFTPCYFMHGSVVHTMHTCILYVSQALYVALTQTVTRVNIHVHVYNTCTMYVIGALLVLGTEWKG